MGWTLGQGTWTGDTRYDVGVMRTTVDLPEDLHRIAKDIAHDMSWTMSQAVVWLMCRGVGEELPKPEMGVDELTGLPVLRTGRLITASEVKRFLDEDE